MATTSIRVTMAAGLSIAAMSVLAVPTATAQDVATSFDGLQAFVKKGDIVIVTDTVGRRTRGTVSELTASSLQILTPKTGSNGRQTAVAQPPWPQGNVALVVLERRDSLWNGTLIGLGIGASLPLISGAQNCQGSCSEPGTVYIAALITGGIAAGVGALVDSVRHQRVTVFQATPQRSSRLSLVPLLAKSGTSVRVSVRF